MQTYRAHAIDAMTGSATEDALRFCREVQFKAEVPGEQQKGRPMDRPLLIDARIECALQEPDAIRLRFEDGFLTPYKELVIAGSESMLSQICAVTHTRLDELQDARVKLIVIEEQQHRVIAMCDSNNPRTYISFADGAEEALIDAALDWAELVASDLR